MISDDGGDDGQTDASSGNPPERVERGNELNELFIPGVAKIAFYCVV